MKINLVDKKDVDTNHKLIISVLTKLCELYATKITDLKNNLETTKNVEREMKKIQQYSTSITLIHKKIIKITNEQYKDSKEYKILKVKINNLDSLVYDLKISNKISQNTPKKRESLLSSRFDDWR